MKNNRGKGYFYAMGQRDKAIPGWLSNQTYWPRWAKDAYFAGYNGWAL